MQGASLLQSRVLLAQTTLLEAYQIKNSTDIDTAATEWSFISTQIPHAHTDYHHVAASLAVALLLRWEAKRVIEDLNNAISLLVQAIVAQGSKPCRALYENYVNLGAAYMSQWENASQNASNIVKAMDSWEMAYDISLKIGCSHESAPVILPHLGDAYCFAYAQKLRGARSLSLAIDRYKAALLSAPVQAQSRLQHKLQYKLGKAYSTLYMDGRDIGDWQSAINYLKTSISGQVSTEEMEDATMEISDLYSCQYQENKAREWLDAAIYWARRAAHIQYEEGIPRILRKIASLLTTMYKDFFDSNSLNEAIECYRQVWDRRETHQLEQPSTFYFNFATALMRRSAILTEGHSQKKIDLQQAIQLLELAGVNDDAEGNFASRFQLKIAKDRLAYEERITSAQTSGNPQVVDDLENQDLPPHYPALSETQPIRQPSFIEIQDHPQNRAQSHNDSTLAPPGIYSPGWHQPNPSILVQLNYQQVKGKDQDNRERLPSVHNHTSSSQEDQDTEEAPTSPASFIDSPIEIKPTDLTGRVVRTSNFPAAEGGFSSIYRGQFGTTKVAIKVIKTFGHINSATLRRRLTREMDVWWKLDHPNIVPLWGYINDLGELPSMVAQWYENGNACIYIEKEVLPVEFRLQLLREVTLGLQYLHLQSPAIIHGDLKPANVLIDNEGVARLSDFGLAHLATSGEVTLGSAGNGATIRYAAPEIRSPADDEASTRATKESDIYSLACIAYEFVYRKLPFAEKPTIQTIIAAGYNHIPPARRDSEDSSVMGPQTLYYWDLLESCWDETPSRRPDITAFCDHIDVIFHDMGTA